MISIVVPVYNAGKWFDSCVESLLKQSHTDIEILLIDDGSTDGSGEKCDRYAETDARIRVFHTENHGVSHARNLGIREARGEHLTFVDSDDWLERDILSRAVQRLQNDNSQLVIYAMQIDRYTGDCVNETPLPIANDEVVTPTAIAQRFGELFYNDYLSSSCTKIFNKNLVVENGLLFDETLAMYEDLDFVLKYISAAKSVSLMKAVGYHYRMDTTVCAVSKRKTDDLLRNIDIVVDGIRHFLRSHDAQPCELDHKVIVDLYLIYLHRLFVNPHTFNQRLRGIRRLFDRPALERAINHCQLLKKQGKFYRILSWCLIRKLALPIYALYKHRY